MLRSKIDSVLLFATRTTRLFAHGFLLVVLVLCLAEIGISEDEIGLLLSLTMVGGVAISLWITTAAEQIGRRRMLVLGAFADGMVRDSVCFHKLPWPC